MARLRVLKHISGSHCVVQLLRLDNYCDHYIDARKHGDDVTHIEVVLSGHVRHQEFEWNRTAPKRIVELTEEYLI